MADKVTYADVTGLHELEASSTIFDRVLVDMWDAENLAAGPKPMSNPEKPIRHSWAGKCARQIGYYMTGQEAAPMDRAGTWVTRLGTEVHELWQEAMSRKFAHMNVDYEYEVQCETDISSGHADAMARSYKMVETIEHRHTSAVELKTINGLGYKQVVKRGPRMSHLYQACVNGYALDADDAVLVYLPMETNRQAPNGMEVGATFIIPREQMVLVAERELARWRKIVDTVKRGYLPPRQIVDDNVELGAVVVDPLTGKLDKAGKTWQCGYCPFQTDCMESGPGLVQVGRPLPEMEELWQLPSQ